MILSLNLNRRRESQLQILSVSVFQEQTTHAGMMGVDRKVEGGGRPLAVQGSRVLGNSSIPPNRVCHFAYCLSELISTLKTNKGIKFKLKKQLKQAKCVSA